MGTGKSGMTVYLCSEEGFQLILILCPLRVVQVWQPQFEMHSTVPFMVVPLDDSYSNVRAKRDEAERKIKLAKARGVPVVVVINYDSAWRSPFAEWALRKRWDLVVADEIHRCKAPGGKASRYLARLGKAARYSWGSPAPDAALAARCVRVFPLHRCHDFRLVVQPLPAALRRDGWLPESPVVATTISMSSTEVLLRRLRVR